MTGGLIVLLVFPNYVDFFKLAIPLNYKYYFYLYFKALLSTTSSRLSQDSYTLL